MQEPEPTPMSNSEQPQCLLQFKDNLPVDLQVPEKLSDPKCFQLVKMVQGEWGLLGMEKILRCVKACNVKGMLFLVKNNEPQILEHLADIRFEYLDQLYIADNLITSLQPLIHLHAPNLSVIWLQNNLVCTLKPLRHCNLPKLAYLRVTQNHLLDSHEIADLKICHQLNLMLEYNKFGRVHYQDIRPFLKLKSCGQDQSFFYIFSMQRIPQVQVIGCLKRRFVNLTCGHHYYGP